MLHHRTHVAIMSQSRVDVHLRRAHVVTSWNLHHLLHGTGAAERRLSNFWRTSLALSVVIQSKAQDGVLNSPSLDSRSAGASICVCVCGTVMPFTWRYSGYGPFSSDNHEGFLCRTMTHRKFERAHRCEWESFIVDRKVGAVKANHSPAEGHTSILTQYPASFQ